MQTSYKGFVSTLMIAFKAVSFKAVSLKAVSFKAVSFLGEVYSTLSSLKVPSNEIGFP